MRDRKAGSADVRTQACESCESKSGIAAHLGSVDDVVFTVFGLLGGGLHSHDVRPSESFRDS